MKRSQSLILSMALTLAVITGFQAWWLTDNYGREKRTLRMKTDMTFQETVRRLQASKLRLKDPFLDSMHKGKRRIFINEDMDDVGMKGKMMPRREVVTMVNAIRDKLKDSSLKNSKTNSTVMISMNNSPVVFQSDSLKMKMTFNERVPGDRIMNVLYGIDSLQDTIHLAEIITAYDKDLAEENISVPFSVTRLDTMIEHDEPPFSDVTVGFVKPITYHLEIGNTVPYLLKRISLPAFFSIFLIGITILSFVLLYRNILKQQRLADIKNEFISNITHELKTPIATVGVAIEALKSFNAIHDPQKTKEYLDISSNELQRLGLLVDKVLKLSMLEKKEIAINFEKVDLTGVVEEVVTSMRLQIEKYGATVTVSRDGDLVIDADRLHLVSVVFNLLDNALKYSKGNADIRFTLQGNDNDVVLGIEDNGIGIEPEYKNRIFEKFFRVPQGNTHNAKGYGLGLSYVSHIVKEHGGKISVESQPGIGTKFTINLPRKKV